MINHEISISLKRFLIGSIYTQRYNSNIQFNNILYSTEYGSVVSMLLPSLMKKLNKKMNTYEFEHCQIMYIFSNLASITIKFDYWDDEGKHEDNIINFDFDLNNNKTQRLNLRKE